MVKSINFSGKMDKQTRRNRIISRRRRNKITVSMDNKDIEKICEYLENPTKSGIWHLKGKWDKKGGISKYIQDELDKELKDKEEIQIQSGKRKIKINLKGEEIEDFLDNVNKMTFIFELFTYFYYLENEPLESFSMHYDIDETIIGIIDTKKLQQKYQDSYEYFKKNIYFDGFGPRIITEEIIRIKEGFFIVTDSLQDSEQLSMMSINPSYLEKLEVFFTKLEKLSESSIIPIYSPEEKVFTPYFSLLGETYSHFIDYENIKRLFEKSIEEYRDGNYAYCVSTIGLIAEDYLTQIYETFYRDICPKGLTLGQIYDSIHNRIQQKFKAKSTPVPNIKPIYDKIKKLNDSDLEEPNNFNVEILELLRETLTYIKEDKRNTKSIIESLEKKEMTYSIFPKYLRENINDLIRYRNATSHKSRIPIGNYEALRTVYCCITLLMWWDNEKKATNWKDDEEIILKDSIERNTGINLN